MKFLKSALVGAVLSAAALASAGSLSLAANQGVTASLTLSGNGVPDVYVFSPTISANTLNYNLKAAAVASGWNQSKPLKATVTINSGVAVGSSSTGTYAFDTGNTFPAGSTLALVNNGYIVGMGGAGAPGGGGGSGASGYAGGPALWAQYAIAVTNNGTIGGGGGGGGASAGHPSYVNGAGGGGAGYTAGLGGSSSGSGTSTNGTLVAGGTGGNTYSSGYPGGTGGALGSAGGSGATWPSISSGGVGGAGGSAVVGNANITWTTVGSRLGAIN